MSDYRERYYRLCYGTFEISRNSTYDIVNPLYFMFGSVYNVVYDYLRIPVNLLISFKFYIHIRIDSSNRKILFEYLSSYKRLEVTERVLNEFK